MDRRLTHATAEKRPGMGRRRFPALSKGEMGSGYAQHHGEEREQERSGGGARRQSELADYGSGTDELRRGISSAWRHDRLGNQRGNEERDPGFIAEQTAASMAVLNARNRVRDSRLLPNCDEQVMSLGDVTFLFIFFFY